MAEYKTGKGQTYEEAKKVIDTSGYNYKTKQSLYAGLENDYKNWQAQNPVSNNQTNTNSNTNTTNTTVTPINNTNTNSNVNNAKPTPISNNNHNNDWATGGFNVDDWKKITDDTQKQTEFINRVGKAYNTAINWDEKNKKYIADNGYTWTIDDAGNPIRDDSGYKLNTPTTDAQASIVDDISGGYVNDAKKRAKEMFTNGSITQEQYDYLIQQADDAQKQHDASMAANDKTRAGDLNDLWVDFWFGNAKAQETLRYIAEQDRPKAEAGIREIRLALEQAMDKDGNITKEALERVAKERDIPVTMLTNPGEWMSQFNLSPEGEAYLGTAQGRADLEQMQIDYDRALEDAKTDKDRTDAQIEKQIASLTKKKETEQSLSAQIGSWTGASDSTAYTDQVLASLNETQTVIDDLYLKQEQYGEDYAKWVKRTSQDYIKNNQLAWAKFNEQERALKQDLLSSWFKLSDEYTLDSQGLSYKLDELMRKYGNANVEALTTLKKTLDESRQNILDETYQQLQIESARKGLQNDTWSEMTSTPELLMNYSNNSIDQMVSNNSLSKEQAQALKSKQIEYVNSMFGNSLTNEYAKELTSIRDSNPDLSAYEQAVLLWNNHPKELTQPLLSSLAGDGKWSALSSYENRGYSGTIVQDENGNLRYIGGGLNNEKFVSDLKAAGITPLGGWGSVAGGTGGKTGDIDINGGGANQSMIVDGVEYDLSSNWAAKTNLGGMFTITQGENGLETTLVKRADGKISYLDWLTQQGINYSETVDTDGAKKRTLSADNFWDGVLMHEERFKRREFTEQATVGTAAYYFNRDIVIPKDIKDKKWSELEWKDQERVLSAVLKKETGNAYSIIFDKNGKMKSPYQLMEISAQNGGGYDGATFDMGNPNFKSDTLFSYIRRNVEKAFNYASDDGSPITDKKQLENFWDKKTQEIYTQFKENGYDDNLLNNRNGQNDLNNLFRQFSGQNYYSPDKVVREDTMFSWVRDVAKNNGAVVNDEDIIGLVEMLESKNYNESNYLYYSGEIDKLVSEYLYPFTVGYMTDQGNIEIDNILSEMFTPAQIATFEAFGGYTPTQQKEVPIAVRDIYDLDLEWFGEDYATYLNMQDIVNNLWKQGKSASYVKAVDNMVFEAENMILNNSKGMSVSALESYKAQIENLKKTGDMDGFASFLTRISTDSKTYEVASTSARDLMASFNEYNMVMADVKLPANVANYLANFLSRNQVTLTQSGIFDSNSLLDELNKGVDVLLTDLKGRKIENYDKIQQGASILGAALVKYIKSISGVAVSDNERAMLSTLFPKQGDLEELTQLKMNNFVSSGFTASYDILKNRLGVNSVDPNSTMRKLFDSKVLPQIGIIQISKPDAPNNKLYLTMGDYKYKLETGTLAEGYSYNPSNGDRIFVGDEVSTYSHDYNKFENYVNSINF